MNVDSLDVQGNRVSLWHDSALLAQGEPFLIELEEACAAICDRCRTPRFVPILVDGEWVHSAEETESGVGLPPELCAADALRKLATAKRFGDTLAKYQGWEKLKAVPAEREA